MESSFPDVIKFIESNYRVEKKKSSRAIAGLSMGGFHSLHISKQYPDMFDTWDYSLPLSSPVKAPNLPSTRIWMRS